MFGIAALGEGGCKPEGPSKIGEDAKSEQKRDNGLETMDERWMAENGWGTMNGGKWGTMDGDSG